MAPKCYAYTCFNMKPLYLQFCRIKCCNCQQNLDHELYKDDQFPANVASILKNGQKDYRGPVSHIAVPWKIMEQHLLKHNSGHKKNKVTGSSQQGFAVGSLIARTKC